MRITFVYPDIATDEPTYAGYFHYGIASLSSVLKKAGHKTSLIQFTKEVSNKEFQEKIKVLKPDLIGFSSTTHAFPFVQKYAAAAKKITKVPIICGGIHPTLSPKEVLEDKNIDMICRGEGEMALIELCQKLAKGQNIEDIENIWVKKEEKIYKNKIRPLISNLDSLPFFDREIFDYPNLNLEKQGIGTFIFSRGCPYQCTFCCEPTLRKLYPNPQNYFRFRSPQLAIEEIKKTVKNYPFIKFIRIDDALLFGAKTWVRKFIPLYQKEVGLPFSIDIRINLIDEEFLTLFKQSGGHLLRLGVESGNDFILKEVMNKGITVRQIKKAFKLIKEKKVKAQAFNMVGLPYERAREILETIKLNAQIEPDISVVSIFYPYPGTYLNELCLQRGFLKKGEDLKIPKNFYSYSVLSLPTIRKEQIDFLFRYFHILKNFYSFLFKIPFSRPLIFFADKFFSLKYIPEVIKVTSDPLRSIIRLVRRRIFPTKTFDSEALGRKCHRPAL